MPEGFSSHRGQAVRVLFDLLALVVLLLVVIALRYDQHPPPLVFAAAVFPATIWLAFDSGMRALELLAKRW